MPLNPATFPRPPLLERVSKHLIVKFPSGQTVADTKNGFWVLETYHPPTYYFPPQDIKVPLTKTPRSSYCEWKGRATYFSLPSPSDNTPIENKAWTYESPTSRFKELKDHVCFYPTAPWECYVDGEKVQPQPGDFYGGWLTSEIEQKGNVKGGPGTLGW